MKSQKEIFDRIFILKGFNTKSEMHNYLADAFCASVPAVAKWCNGYTTINYETLRQIVNHFELSPADLFNENEYWTLFNFKKIDMKDISTYRTYMESFRNILAYAVDAPDVQIFFHADEIPIFHFMHYTKLTYLKLYAYAYDKDKLDITYEEFCNNLSTYELEPVFHAIANYYSRIPSIEIWDDQVIDNVLFQIKHFEILNRFSDPLSKQILLDELMDLINSFKLTATNGEKSTSKRFDFFRKPAPLRKGYMILQANNQKTLSLKIDTINSMTSNRSNAVNFFYNSFRATMDKSTALGIGAEGDRVRYFRRLIDKINTAYLNNKQ